MVAAWNFFVIPLLLAEIHAIVFPDIDYTRLIDIAAAMAGVKLAGFITAREIDAAITFKIWLHQTVAGMLRWVSWTAFAVAVFLMPKNIGFEMLMVAGGYLAFHFAVQFGLWMHYLRWVHFLKPASERLRRIVDETSARMSVPVRGLEQLRGTAANAFAIVTQQRLIFTDRLVEVCDDNELSAVCAHELGHLSESKTVLAGRLIASLSWFPLIFIAPCVQAFGLQGMIGPYLGTFLLGRFGRSLSLKMEKRADHLATADQSQERVYAGALEKLYRFNQTPAVNYGNRRTHPHLYDRLVSAGVTPDFPRPEPPQYYTWPGYLCAIAAVALGVIAAIQINNFDPSSSPFAGWLGS
jgi:Zn-dependent protease with chaperone function